MFIFCSHRARRVKREHRFKIRDGILGNEIVPLSLCAIDARPSEHPGADRRQRRCPADTWADTTTSHGRLMLAVLGGLAAFERDLMRARTTEGRPHIATGGQRPQLLS